ncbi:LysR family transcriptional regulator (plasmid) [Paracoccus versutus]|uniref:DNA-binding transcriptional LysR family regulator n=1 Tax=Paracoccus versutus TaxID=34007 RepID=A0AAQ0KLG2_PARVE|nr:MULTISPECIES: LysR family transcriptional regulator [Paracoccus]SFX69731.1 DNA-binding transcriptional regulator, LysR family [Paracoccus pantotrophus]KGJ12128.1 LysR family transcriptional regulator [Paracoccus versutus]MBT0782761.1 LysR family transcriptional regulator [Paracoccus sp. pheM1]MCJ1900006.1 LysR family transcriptional regulator [Paracoccus versutus]MDF3904434.1 LysR family transcriptional regulator [Paracoccus sp. AS002]
MHTSFLKYFDEVARQRSIRKAAQLLNVSSTSVNRKILNVEQRLGVSIFDRTPEGVELTAVGAILLEHCRTVLHDFERTKILIDDMRDLRTGHINIHTIDSIAMGCLPRAMNEFGKIYPDISISVTTAQPEDALQAVAGGAAEIGIAFTFSDHPGVRLLSEKSAPFGVIVRPDHPLAGRTSVTIDDIAAYRLVRTIDARGGNSIIDQAITTLVTPLSTHIFTNTLFLAKQMILGGHGIGLYTKIGFYDDVEDGQLRFVPLIQEMLANIRVGIFVSTSSPIDPAKHLMCNALAKEMASMRLDS